MKINTGALIFAGVLLVVALLIAGVVFFSNLATQNSSEGGTARDLFSSLFPFGQATQRSPGSGIPNEEGGVSGPVPALREISREPVAGFSTAGGVIRFAERDTGHILETAFDNLETKRLTNTTIPGVERAVWLYENTVIFQRAGEGDIIQNSLVTYSTTTVDEQATARSLSEFTSATPVVDKNRVILSTRSGGTTIISSTDLKVGQKKTLFSSPLRSWRVLSAGDDVLIQTAPSDEGGFLYRVLSDGGLERILGNVRGLLAIARDDGEYVAVSSVDEKSIRLSFVDRAGKIIGSSPVGTFADKCAWFTRDARVACGVPQSLTGASVEAWLMGLQSFNDAVWVIDPVRGTSTFIRNLEAEAGRPLDVIDAKVSADGRYVVFRNKNDLSLWSLDLEAQ